MIKTAMTLMLSTYYHQKTKTITNQVIVKKIAQTFLKASSIILQRNGSSVATLKHYCLDYVLFKSKSLLIWNVPKNPKKFFQRWIE